MTAAGDRDQVHLHTGSPVLPGPAAESLWISTAGPSLAAEPHGLPQQENHQPQSPLRLPRLGTHLPQGHVGLHSIYKFWFMLLCCLSRFVLVPVVVLPQLFLV